MLEEIGELRTRAGQITIGILIAQDLAVVPMMLIIGAFRGGRVQLLEALLKVALSIGFLAALILYLCAAGACHLSFASLLSTKPDLAPIMALGLCFSFAAASGLSACRRLFGAFLAGLVSATPPAPGTIHHTAPIEAVLLMVVLPVDRAADRLHLHSRQPGRRAC